MKICFLLPFIFLTFLWTSSASAEKIESQKEEQLNDEFEDLLEGRATSKTQKTVVSSLIKISIDKKDYLKIRSRGDLYPLLRHLIKEEVIHSTNDDESKTYYSLAIDQRIVNDVIKVLKEKKQDKGFLKKLNLSFIRRHLPSLFASSSAFAIVSGVLCPFVFAPAYSYLTNYKYGGVELDDGSFNLKSLDAGKNWGDFFRNIKVLELQVLEKTNNSAIYSAYLSIYVAMNIFNSLIGLPSPPNTIFGGMKLGAFLGAIYYFGFSNFSSKFLNIVSGIVDLPNWIAFKVMNRFTSLNQKIDGFFYTRKHIPIKTKKEEVIYENEQ